jgi:hypothetical protein
LAGWFALVATKNPVNVLLNAAALQFAINRDAWIARTPPYVIKNNIGTIINDVAVSPIFAGSNYPTTGLS